MWWLWLIGGVLLIFGIVVFRGAPYVPSKRADLRNALDKIYKLKSSDVLVDIGSGDGVVLRMVSSYGARAVGYEINPILVFISRLISWQDKRVVTRLADYWLVKFPDNTTVVYTFGESRHIGKMAAKVQSEANRLDKTIYFLSYAFEVPHKEYTKKSSTHYLYEFRPLQSSQA